MRCANKCNPSIRNASRFSSARTLNETVSASLAESRLLDGNSCVVRSDRFAARWTWNLRVIFLKHRKRRALTRSESHRLGAQTADILRIVVRQGLAFAVAGAAVGLVGRPYRFALNGRTALRREADRSSDLCGSCGLLVAVAPIRMLHSGAASHALLTRWSR